MKRFRRILSGFLAMLLLLYGVGPNFPILTDAFALENDITTGVVDSTEGGTSGSRPFEPKLRDPLPDDVAPVFNNDESTILIYSYDQVCLIGSGELVRTHDAETDLIGAGDPIATTDGLYLAYRLDGKYSIVEDILMPNGEIWEFPEGFTGQIVPKDNAGTEPPPLYNAELDAIYLYHPYQLMTIMRDDADIQPVMSQDYDAEYFGIGTTVYHNGEKLTYSAKNNYILSANFSSNMPKLLASSLLVNDGDIEWLDDEQPDGRSYPGQVHIKIGNDDYILIGNEAQLRAIGTNKHVTPRLYIAETYSYDNRIFGIGTVVTNATTYIPYYPGDADLGMTGVATEAATDHTETYYATAFSSGNSTTVRDEVDGVSYLHYSESDYSKYELADIDFGDGNFLSGLLNSVNGLVDSLLNILESVPVLGGLIRLLRGLALDAVVEILLGGNNSVLAGLLNILGFDVEINSTVFCGVNEYGLPNKNIDMNALKAEYGNLRYSSDANYIIFRDIDLSKGENSKGAFLDWDPIAFSGQMIGAKVQEEDKTVEGALQAVAASIIEGKIYPDNSRPMISNVKVEQTDDKNASDARGVGFFSTITNINGISGNALTSSKAYVSNIELKDIKVSNYASDVENDETLVSGLVSTLGNLLGGILDGLGDILGEIFGGDNPLESLTGPLRKLLDLRKSDPAFYATGAFAGVVDGDVLIEKCIVNKATVSNSEKYTGGFVGFVNGGVTIEDSHVSGVTVSNEGDYTGGFAGCSEGATQYALDGVVDGTLDLLASILNIIPGIGLGDLTEVVKDLKLGTVIVTGYINPEISNCTVSGLTGTIGTSDTDYAGGFIGAQSGTNIKACKVLDSTYIVSAKNYGGGFAGIARDGNMDTILNSLVGMNPPVAQRQSILLNCEIINSNITVTGGSRLGGFAGAMFNSYAVNDSIYGGTLTVTATGSYAGGFAGEATLGWSLGKEEETVVDGLIDTLEGLLGGEGDEAALISFVGASPSAVLGCQICCSSIWIRANGDYAGGMVGRGNGLILASSSAKNLKNLSNWKYNSETVIERRSYVAGLEPEKPESVHAGGDYAGGLVGYIGTASVSGLLNDIVGVASFIGFTVEDAYVVGKPGGYSVTAGGSYAGGGFGFAMGGDITNVSLERLNKVDAYNHAGGFVGCAGPGELAGDNGLELKILGIKVLSLKNLLSLGQNIQVTIKNSNVKGVEEGFTVVANKENTPGGETNFTAAGFIANSNSTVIENSNVYNLKCVRAPKNKGFAGGFIGTSQAGGLAEVADKDAIGGIAGSDGLLDVDSLLGAAKYLLPSYTNCTVTFVDGGHVKADVAGGFVGDLQSGSVNNEGNKEDIYKGPYAVLCFGSFEVKGQTYGGGFGGKVRSGALADAGGGVSVLGGLKDIGLTINVSELLGVAEAYIPSVSYAGVYSKTGFTVEAKEVGGDTNSGSAGGFAGYASGAQISNSDVAYLKHTKVYEPENLDDLETLDEATAREKYFNEDVSTYAVTGGRYAGGYVGHMDIGDAASVGEGISLLGSSVNVSDLVSSLSVVVSTIEYSDVYGEARGGYAVLASAENDTGKLGMAGGFAGKISGGHIQDSNAHVFSHIIGEISAGGYVGTMIPGDVANVLSEASISDKGVLGALGELIGVTELASLVQDFVPTIRNSSTDSVPCGGVVRANAPSTGATQRGMAGGYVGHNKGGHIWGSNNDDWKGKPLDSEHIKDCKAIRIRSVWGYEYAGGFTGYMECGDTASAGGGISILGSLIQVDGLLSVLKFVYPTQENTEVNGPLRELDVYTWNNWVIGVGVKGGFGKELAETGTVDTENQSPEQAQAELNAKLGKYIYGYHVVVGRSEYDKSTTANGGDAGGYVGRMSGGTITNSTAKDARLVRAPGSAGGFAGKMLSGNLANFGKVDVLGGFISANLGELLNIGQLFVPVIKSSSVQGYSHGLTVQATKNDETHRFGYAGGYVGSAYGAQIWGDEGDAQGCNVSKLRRVQGDIASGGYVGIATAGSVADVNTNASSGFLQDVLDSLIETGDSLAGVMEATMTTIRKAEVTAQDSKWGFVVEGFTKVEVKDNADKIVDVYFPAKYAGGFAGQLEAAVIGEEKIEIVNGKTVYTYKNGATVSNLRSVDGGLYAGGFFGLADATSVASVSESGDTSILLGLITAGGVDALNAFRSYVYDSSVSGVPEGITVTAHSEGSEGLHSEKRAKGNAGGFGGGLLNGSVHKSHVHDLNAVTAPNYAGGFIGYMGKSGVVDADGANLLELLDLNAGVLDVFGSNVTKSSVTGIDNGYLVNAIGGQEPVAGGFVGYADLAQLEEDHAYNAKQINSDQIAGGFVGRTTMEYVIDLEVGDSEVLDALLDVLNPILGTLFEKGRLEDIGLLDVDIPLFLKLDLLDNGQTVTIDVLGGLLHVSVKLIDGGQTAMIDLGWLGYIEVKKSDWEESGNLTRDNIDIKLIEANRTRVKDCSVEGISIGYDVYGGGAGNNDQKGTNPNGYTGGFVGYNDKGTFNGNNQMFNCDVVCGTTVDSSGIFGRSTSSSAQDIVGGANMSITATPAKESGTEVTKVVFMGNTPTYPNPQSLVPEPDDGIDPCDDINLTIQKIWDDGDDKDGLRQESIIVKIWQIDDKGNRTLYKTNLPCDEEGWLEITQGDHDGPAAWKHVVENLPAFGYDGDGNIVYYTYEVEEKSIGEYTTTVVNQGFVSTIRNTHEPEEPEPPIEPEVTHDLTVSKTVTGNLGDRRLDFNFTITMTDENGQPVPGTFNVVHSGNSDLTQLTFDESGNATVKLKHGETITFKDLPDGTRYSIEETDADAYDTSISNNGEDVQGKTATGTMGSDVTVAYTNERVSSIPTNATTEYAWLALVLLTVCIGVGIIALKKRREKTE